MTNLDAKQTEQYDTWEEMYLARGRNWPPDMPSGFRFIDGHGLEQIEAEKLPIKMVYVDYTHHFHVFSDYGYTLDAALGKTGKHVVIHTDPDQAGMWKDRLQNTPLQYVATLYNERRGMFLGGYKTLIHELLWFCRADAHIPELRLVIPDIPDMLRHEQIGLHLLPQLTEQGDTVVVEGDLMGGFMLALLSLNRFGVNTRIYDGCYKAVIASRLRKRDIELRGEAESTGGRRENSETP